MIQVYKASNTNFSSNGDMTLLPMSCDFSWKLNGVCEIELEHEIDDVGRWKYLVNDNIIACPTPYSEKQLFRIYDKVPNGSTVIAYARHIFFDLVDKVLIDVMPTDATCQEALNAVLSGTSFTGSSDIITRHTKYYIRKNIVEAIAGTDENSFINTWGGERFYDNFKVYINQRIGGNYGVRAEFGHNMTGIEVDESAENVVTRIIPVGYNGIMLEGATPWVDSSYIENYPHPKERVIEYSNIKVKESGDATEGYSTLAEAQAALIAAAKAEFKAGIDVPLVNYKVTMQELANTQQYKKYAMLESVSLGDVITCKHRKLNIDIKARCISLEYDCINKKNISVELGNFTDDYFDNLSTAASLINSITGGKSNTVLAEKITGIINAVSTQFRAQSSIAQRQDVRAILFEDLDPASPTFGAMCLGTLGFEIASQRTVDGKDWDWNTFGTGQGFFADYIVAGTMLADRIFGGTLTLGGVNNGNGICEVKDSNGNVVVKLDTNGVTATAGTFSGNVSGATVSGTAISGGTVSGATVTGTTIQGGTITGSNLKVGALENSKYDLEASGSGVIARNRFYLQDYTGNTYLSFSGTGQGKLTIADVVLKLGKIRLDPGDPEKPELGSVAVFDTPQQIYLKGKGSSGGTWIDGDKLTRTLSDGTTLSAWDIGDAIIYISKQQINEYNFDNIIDVRLKEHGLIP